MLWLPRRLNYSLLSLACVALSGLATYGAFEIFYPVRVPAAMRGKWVVVEGKGLNGATLEFFVDGHMIGTVPAENGWLTIEGSVEVHGNRFRVITRNPDAGVPSRSEDRLELTHRWFFATEPEDIVELTDHWFVVQDSQGEVLIMHRPAPAGAKAEVGNEK
jgi:hypothetical protein